MSDGMHPLPAILFLCLCSLLLMSCSGGGTQVVGVTPFIVHNSSSDPEKMYVFTEFDGSVKAKSIQIQHKNTSLTWKTDIVFPCSEKTVYCVFRAAQEMPIPIGDYTIIVTDEGGDLLDFPFSVKSSDESNDFVAVYTDNGELSYYGQKSDSWESKGVSFRDCSVTGNYLRISHENRIQ